MTSTITIRMDEELKSQFEELVNDLGLNLTTAITAFAKQSVREQQIPFKLTKNVPNETTAKAIEDARNGVGMSREFHSVKELMEDLDADAYREKK